MKIMYRKKSQKTMDRINAIKADLRCYHENIQLLHEFAERRKTLKGGDYVDRAAYYKRTPEDDERYFATLKNIKAQIILLEYELEVLKRYGA